MRKRHCHYIKRNHNTETPCHAVWFDTETTQRETAPETLTHALSFGWAAYARKRSNGVWTKPQWHRFETADEFFTWIESIRRKKTKLHMFCHNTSFDIPVIDAFRNLALRGWVMSMACIDAPPTIVKLRKDTTTIVILDTLNIFRMSLAQLGAHIGLEKFDMPSVAARSAAGDKYCKRDVEIIMTACIKWWDFLTVNDLGGFAPTLAGQALRAFRHRFMSHEILIDNNAKATETSRKAYYGGRTECFRLGHIKEHLTLLDVNSMYPAVMQFNKYPVKLIGTDRNPDDKTLQNWLSKFLMCTRVTLDTNEAIYPLRTKDKLIFPVGKFTTYLSTPEIIRAYHADHITKVHEVSLYAHAPIFTEFVNYFYNKRLEAVESGNKTEALLHKNLLTNLYGKFGQRGLIWENKGQTDDLSSGTWEELDADTGKVYRHRQLGGLVQAQYDEQESRDSFPAIAAHVTAYARILLYNMINIAGKENVYYVDTDSLLVNDCGLRRLDSYIDPSRLGCLKVEGVYDDVEIFGAKDYRFGTKERHKGVKKNAAWLADNIVQQQQWSSLSGLLKTGSVSKPTTKTIYKTLRREYNKGTVDASGYVLPFKLTGAESQPS